MNSGRNRHNLCIILVNYHNYSDTISCIESIQSSECDKIPFIVVVDIEASGDDSLKLLKNEGIHIIPLSENVGFGRANNIACQWAVANGGFNFIFLLNNDTLLRKDTIRVLTDGIDRYRDVKIFSPLILTMETPPKIWYDGGFIDPNRMTPVIFNIGLDASMAEKNDSSTGFVSGCAILLSTSIFNTENQVFDPYFFMYDEDTDFSIRMNRGGLKMIKLCNAVVYHKCQGSFSSGEKKVINQLHPGHPSARFYLSNTIKNRYYLIRKHYSGTKKANLFLKVSIYWALKTCQYLIFLKPGLAFSVVSEVLKSLNCKTYRSTKYRNRNENC